MSEFVKVGKLKDFKDGALTGIDVGGRAICVARAAGTLYAFDDLCTHAHALLSRGDLEDSEVVCPLHGARFSVTDGQALTPPAVKPVQVHDVKVQGDDVLIKVS